MLIQLHHQFKDEHTKMCAQKDLIGDQEELREWFKEIEKDHPLPEGAQWLFVPETSKYFVWAKKE